MPGNRVNVRLVVKPKSTPYVPPTPYSYAPPTMAYTPPSAASTRSSINWLVIGCGIALVAAFIWVTAGWQTFTNNQANQSWTTTNNSVPSYTPTATEGPYEYDEGSFSDSAIGVATDIILIVSPGNSITVSSSSWNEYGTETINVGVGTKLIFVIGDYDLEVSAPEESGIMEQYNITGDEEHLARDDAASQSNINSIVYNYNYPYGPDYVTLTSLCTTPGLSCSN
ncbi:MAG: hypothetical protein ABSE17_02885 [Candidatus Levyibacteriota bacterium]